MSNDIASSSNNSNNLNDEETENTEPADPEILKDRMNTFKTVFIYALFLFIKITCFIFINANIIFFLTYLFERIYYKKFTVGNMDKKKQMVEDYNAYLDKTFPSDRKQQPYTNKMYMMKQINPLLYNCPIDKKDNKSSDNPKNSNSGNSSTFVCTDKNGEVPCPPASDTSARLSAASARLSAASARPSRLSAASATPSRLSAASATSSRLLAEQPAGLLAEQLAEQPIQQGGVGNAIIKNINNLSKKVFGDTTTVKKNIFELYKQSGGGGDGGDGDGGQCGLVHPMHPSQRRRFQYSRSTSTLSAQACE